MSLLYIFNTLVNLRSVYVIFDGQGHRPKSKVSLQEIHRSKNILAMHARYEERKSRSAEKQT